MSQPSFIVPRGSWGALTVLSTLFTLATVWVALTPIADQTELADRTWDQFAQGDPEVASLYAMDVAILGMLGTGLGVLAVVVSSIPYRRGARWAWYALWLLPITIGAVAVRMLMNQYPAGTYYAGLTVVAVVALVIPIRSFLRQSDPAS
jgi:hypothetical protein